MEENRKRICIYIDDRRTPTTTIPGYHPWIVIRSANEFERLIKHGPLPHFISFDHDLGDEHYIDHAEQVSKLGFQSPNYALYKEKTGLDCAKYLCQYYEDVYLHLGKDEEHTLWFPKCSVHSSNPVGALNIQSYINGYCRHMGLEENCYIGTHPFKIEEK